METNLTTLIVAVLGAGGLGAVIREVVGGLAKLGRGVSLRESGRKNDLVSERDNALARATRMENERDAADRNHRRSLVYATQLVRIIVANGYQGVVPDEPEWENTITPAQKRKLTGENYG